MSFIEIIVLAYALSIDAFVVSFSYGMTFKHLRKLNCTLLASYTGIFQVLMPIIGYFLTGMVKDYISPYSKYIICVIFGYLGIKFIFEAFEKKRPQKLCLDTKCLILIGIATSIDAFSAGISLSLYGNSIFTPAIFIGIITFANSAFGFLLGGKLLNFQTKYLEVFAGILLIAIGLKALI